jgi:HD superfamily phosphodiesterase
MKIWEKYPKLTAAVKKTHREYESKFGVKCFYAHDFNHVVRVANACQIIAPDGEERW